MTENHLFRSWPRFSTRHRDWEERAVSFPVPTPGSRDFLFFCKNFFPPLSSWKAVERVKMAEGGKTTAATADPYPVMIPNVTIVIDQDSDLQNGGSAFEAPWIPDNLGVEGAYECTRNFSASIMANGTLAGKLTATIVDRKGPFYAACDAESSELQEISCVLFGSKGQVSA